MTAVGVRGCLYLTCGRCWGVTPNELLHLFPHRRHRHHPHSPGHPETFPMNPCDTVGGICYEQVPEGTVLLIIIAIMVIAHLLLVAVPIWWQTRQHDQPYEHD